MKLVLIPCPISENTASDVLPADVSKYVLLCKHYLVENVRTARRFISELKLGINIEELTFEILDKDSTRSLISSFISKHKQEEYVGVLSEAGCPGIADPGALAVSIAQEMNMEVIPLVGPSSILLALMGSGFSGQSFAFHGYLPIDKKERAATLKKLEQESIREKRAQLFMETPFRNNQLLADALSTLAPHTKLCIAKNLTAADELIQTKTIADWKIHPLDLHKVPTVFILQAF